jgi:phosphopantetheinyl transferase
MGDFILICAKIAALPQLLKLHTQFNSQILVWHITEPEIFFADERPAMRVIANAHKRLQHLAGWHSVHLLLPNYQALHYTYSVQGKPVHVLGQAHISITHAGAYAGAMVNSQVNIGIDLELIQAKIEIIAPKFCTTTEIVVLEDEEESIALKLTRIWSAKEALYKLNNKLFVNFKQGMQLCKAIKTPTHYQLFFIDSLQCSWQVFSSLVTPELVLSYVEEQTV